MRAYPVPWFPRAKVRLLLAVVALAALLGTLLVTGAGRVPSTQAASSTGWPTYQFDNTRSGFNASETLINPTSARNLKLRWTATSSGCSGSPGGPTDISSQPVVGFQMIFWGSWDGCEHATNLSGQQVWSTFIGQINSPQCSFPSVIGVASTATVATLTIGGVSTPVVLVGGGDANFYALNATTGAIIWKTPLGSQTGSFLWSSPAMHGGIIYEGLSSQLDCPLVQGQFFQLDATTGTILHTFNVVPTGCTGGGVWGSPTLDLPAGALYFATGNPGTCAQPEPYAPAIVELSLANLTYLGSWQVPTAQQVHDSDFGDTPTLFQATINGVLTSLVGVQNKNGQYYAFVRGSLSNGPVWQATISSNPAGEPNNAPSAWDGSTLYVGGSDATISGTTCNGKGSSLQALNPATGAFLWQQCLLGVCCEWGAVTAVPGLVVAAGFNTLRVLASATGKILFSYTDKSTHGLFYGAASISKGVLYIGDTNGNLYAFSP
jgi:polyvinyl alcohol dehydrogenase (cytochrome)